MDNSLNQTSDVRVCCLHDNSNGQIAVKIVELLGCKHNEDSTLMDQIMINVFMLNYTILQDCKPLQYIKQICRSTPEMILH